MVTEYFQTSYCSPLGELTLCASRKALAGLWFPRQKYFGSSLPAPMIPREDLSIFLETRNWLDRYFSGQNPSPDSLPLAPVGSPFRLQVWQLLLTIPYGETVTYGTLAARLAAGTQRARMSAQAVGNAVGHNPISIIIPCHRVVGWNGSLTGYAGGLERKRWLLEHEQRTHMLSTDSSPDCNGGTPLPQYLQNTYEPPG